MQLFDEIEGTHEDARRGTHCAYKATYVVRDNRLWWTASVGGLPGPEVTVCGVGLLLRRVGSLKDAVRQQVHEAIEAIGHGSPGSIDFRPDNEAAA